MSDKHTTSIIYIASDVAILSETKEKTVCGSHARNSADWHTEE